MEEVKREIELDCDIDRAWQAITDERQLEQWLGGEVRADLAPGGEITVRESDGTVRDGFFETIEPGSELSFWWSTESEEESSRVSLEVRPSTDGDGCVVRVTESRPMIALEAELAQVMSAERGSGPVASATFACV